MARPQKIRLIVYYPKTDDGKRELAQQVAIAHADAVEARLRRLDCPSTQKLALLDAIIQSAKARTPQKASLSDSFHH